MARKTFRSGKARSCLAGGSRLQPHSSLPGLTRQSIDLREESFCRKMDARVKPAHDDIGLGEKIY
jgi:hypothetical protein